MIFLDLFKVHQCWWSYSLHMIYNISFLEGIYSLKRSIPITIFLMLMNSEYLQGNFPLDRGHFIDNEV